MAKGLLDLLQNRSEAVFLPVISFGYIYSKHKSLTTCGTVTETLPSLGYSSNVFLWLALGSTILASFMYGAGGNPDKPTEPRDLLSLPMFASVLHILLMVLSFVELIARVCSGDLLILGLAFLYIALAVIQVTEQVYT
jgi:hypothetical protein